MKPISGNQSIAFIEMAIIFFCAWLIIDNNPSERENGILRMRKGNVR